MKLKIFTKNDCPNCPPARKLAKELEKEGKLEIENHNADEPDGLAEAQFYDVLATPSLILCDEADDEIISWRGKAPLKKDIYKEMAQ